MQPFNLYTAADIQRVVAQKIKNVRRSKGWTQKEMAHKADIPLSTYARFEQRGEGSMRDFAKIVVTLGRADEIDKLFYLPVENKSPMDLYREIEKGK